MPKEDIIQPIIDHLREGLDVEVKNWLNGLKDNNDKAALAKEIIALGNSGGGYIFIGFKEENREFIEVPPDADDLKAFTQDLLAAVVHRYVTPACQCDMVFRSRSNSDQKHPVIMVPGNHRTPLFASKGSSDNKLKDGKVYVRRPGGNSEEARTQDDWEKLIDRFVRVRQSEMLSSMREILNPSIHSVDSSQLEDWDSKQYQQWKEIVDKFDETDPRKLQAGHWTVSFAISSFHADNLSKLNDVLSRDMPKHTSWPPFAYLQGSKQPFPDRDCIKAYPYLGELTEGETPDRIAKWCDYWVICQTGNGFMLRPMQENFIYPLEGCFDWIIPIWRVTEILLFIKKLAEMFNATGSKFKLLLKYKNTKGSKLVLTNPSYGFLSTGQECRISSLETVIEEAISEIGPNLDEFVWKTLVPVFEQFEFVKLPKEVVSNVVKKVFDSH